MLTLLRKYRRLLYVCEAVSICLAGCFCVLYRREHALFLQLCPPHLCSFLVATLTAGGARLAFWLGKLASARPVRARNLLPPPRPVYAPLRQSCAPGRSCALGRTR
ncbi:MAG: hypothetical protein J3K34DRAFT_404449 [Monoraphidium minutum]|nr:MAG: hypothetical protein J3K34DRAFT_404449 [Monoraphidium minutum]